MFYNKFYYYKPEYKLFKIVQILNNFNKPVFIVSDLANGKFELLPKENDELCGIGCENGVQSRTLSNTSAELVE